ncbi:SCAM3 protein, partial [Polyodon spathula]|nr:SCAM3 protein [Polyodon spathula]
MSQYTRFPDPTETANPFQDPAVTQHHTPSTGYATLDLYNPFDSSRGVSVTPAGILLCVHVSAPLCRNVHTATLLCDYTGWLSSASSQTDTHTAAQVRRQDSHTAAQVRRQDSHTAAQVRRQDSHTAAQNNWPPFPSFCPIQPCFYQDISVEIGQDFQRTVSTMYYFWMFSGCTLIFNFIANLALFCVDTSAGVGLGLAILWILIFTPCSFLCWYRPMYKAFRSDSSFNFFFFFFVFFVQVCLYVMQAVGIPNWGFR